MPRWLLWTFVALGSWGVWAILSKLIGSSLSAAHSQALSTMGFLPILAVLAIRPGPAPNGDPRRGTLLALAAGVFSCLGNLAYYASLQRGEKAATVIPLTALYPIVTIALAVTILGERLGFWPRIGLLLSLAATYLFNVPSETGILSSAIFHALPPIGFWGLAGFFQKVSTHHISGERSTLWFLVAALPIAGVILMASPLDFSSITPRLAWLVGVLGLSYALGNLALLIAFARNGKASVITPLSGLYPLVSIPIAIGFLGEKVSPRELGGITLALLSVLALAREEPPAPSASGATP